MKVKIVHDDAPVLLVGGGEVDQQVLAAALPAARQVVAADGGAVQLLSLGRMPDAVYGDMDSLSPEVQGQLAPGVLRAIPEQNSTDFDKCLRHIEAPLVLGYGFLGHRLDHQLAAMTVLVRRADRRCLLIGAEDVVMVCPPQLSLDLPNGTRFSLYPMAPVTGRSTGLRWPIDGLAFTPAGTTGTSNEVSGPVQLHMDAPAMLLILPVACLSALLAGLADAPGTWPARE
ncbi:thiamine pyrophosphokinase [Antarctobacter heliothermus]|uniref:Thiamine diphosphokinase n=1 Tax=Antarctobacter heliothermus TaxID=74033 RepID=A0A222EAD2_9RHOB|nr:thiamine diphosphokinase [Antarctobacter heliothermus]ASP22921.1 thiamine pyrophosphokinase [Antarctobacter heliothermus]